MMSGLEQEIRICDVAGSRIAAAVVGVGPPLVLPCWWVSHLSASWATRRFRDFIGGLAKQHTVIRYDRTGTGLSDRVRGAEQLDHEWELRTLRAVVDTLQLDRFDFFGISYGGAIAASYATQHPERVGRFVTFGAFADGGAGAPVGVRESLLRMVLAHWGLGSRTLADVWVPCADAEERADLAELQRVSATPEMAAALLQLAYSVDAREIFGRLRIPALVLHRRDDRAVSFEQAVELATLIPGARLLSLDGSAHPPWHGHSGSVVASVLAFLAEGDGAEGISETSPRHPIDVPLSERERAVLRLVAAGLSNTQIAQTLFLSPHTVHRHVANIRAKLHQPTRAGAAATAVQLGLI